MAIKLNLTVAACIVMLALLGCGGARDTGTADAPPQGVEESKASAQQRPEWPWSVHGRVTDEQGEGLPGVTVHASCGWGTLKQTGSATTDAEGRYRMNFGPGRATYSHGHEVDVSKTVELTHVQAAVITPRKSGWYEVNLARQGDQRMAGALPESPQDRRSIGKEIILPNQPRRIDFVMARAAGLSGRVVTAAGAPVKDTRFYITGDELGPAGSVLGQFVTDEAGLFVFRDIPLRTYWFTTTDRNKQMRSNAVSFDRPDRHTVLLVVDQQNDRMTATLDK